MRKGPSGLTGLSRALRGSPAQLTHFFGASAGLASSVEAGAVESVGVDSGVAAGSAVGVAAGELVLLVVDGSSAGLLSLPPQAARTAMAERIRSFFIILPPGTTFSADWRAFVKEKWRFRLSFTRSRGEKRRFLASAGEQKIQ